MNKINNKKKYSGISLVEVMTVIAIIAIMTLIAWQALIDARKNSAVNSACDQLVSSINKARGYALSGKRAEGSNTIVVAGSGGSYSITGMENTETYGFQGGVSVRSFHCNFNIPSGVVSGCSTILFSGSSKIIDVNAFSAKCK